MPDYLDRLNARGLVSDDVADRLRETMTHQAEQPNPVRPIIDAARGYLQSGDFNPVHEPGTQPADYLRELARNPDILARNIDQASQFNFGGMANPTPVIAGNAARIARINDMIARGESKQGIADAEGIGKASLDRWLAKTGQKTAGQENFAENPGYWTPETTAAFKADINGGTSIPEAAKKHGISYDAADAKIRRLLRAGEWKDYPSRDPYFFESQKRMDRLEQLGREGYSVRAMARDNQLGATSPGQISGWIDEMQTRHRRMLDYVPQGGSRNVDPYNFSQRTIPDDPLWGKARQIAGQSGETPGSVYQRLKGRQGAGGMPQDDPEATKAVIDFLRSRGLHVEAAQLSRFG